MDALIIITIGALVASCGGLLGSFVLLRRLSMMGDAISHAVVPGIVVAYFLEGGRNPVGSLLGAAAFGIVVTVLIELLSKKARMQEDAAIGMAFSGLFAFGIILITLWAGQIELDEECVLFGEIAMAPLDSLYVNGQSYGPKALWTLGALLILTIALLATGFKGFLITSFDSGYAKAKGISSTVWHYVLMLLVSVATVFSFESVGSVMVIAFLVGPASIAYLLCSSVRSMLLTAVLAGCLASVGGYYLAAWLDASISAAMGVMLGAELLLALGWKALAARIGKTDASLTMSEAQ